MKIDRIIYKQKLPTGSYLNEDIGLEGALEEGDDPLEQIKKLRELTYESHKAQYPHLYTASGKPVIVEQADPQADEENIRLFNEARTKISKAKTKEMAELILNESGFRFNLELKEIVHNKLSKISINGKQEKK